MKKGVFQTILILCLVCLCVTGFYVGRYALQMPFRATNDALHKDGAPLTLDFLQPGGVHFDEKVTIGEAIKTKLNKTGSPFERFLRTVSDQIPLRYRYIGDVLLFLFWTLCFLSFLRVFTFMGYGRALRISLMLGGIVYYFMPDLTPGRADDTVFILFPLLIILLRWHLVRRGRTKDKIFKQPSSRGV